ncbi:hypothetical protein BH09SUM1_BH09SUM1_27490 [soil metagenome]
MTNKLFAALLFGAFAAVAFPVFAQDATPEAPTPAAQDKTPAPTSAAPTEAAMPAASATAPETPVVGSADPATAMIPEVPKSQATLWRLQGGGEVVGTLIKQTPSSYFIDIGPTVIDVPTASVMEHTLLSELKADASDKAGVGSGVFDPETGSLIFHSREVGSRIYSQQEILENVKRGVVVVSNPGGLGTGWLVDNEGHIVTNHHVVGNETYQTVTLFVKNGSQWEKKRVENCKVEAFSTLLDIALVKLDMDKVKELGVTLYPLEIAAAGDLQAGDSVYAVGNPGMGYVILDQTISQGVVSSLARNFNDVLYLQTTAAVNPGNSGGPLLNQRGQVVGLVTLKAVFQEGVAFALPVDYMTHFLGHSRAYAVNELNRNQGYRYHRPQ